jgi:malic enzyme
VPFAHDGAAAAVSYAGTVLLFPAVALGAIAAKAYEITSGMFRAAAERLAEEVTPQERGAGLLLPSISRLREITPRLAEAVARAARDAGVGLPLDDGAIAQAVADARWEPSYPVLDPMVAASAVETPDLAVPDAR